jgi:hypothetical protein
MKKNGRQDSDFTAHAGRVPGVQGGGGGDPTSCKSTGSHCEWRLAASAGRQSDTIS